jgi:hypothetical protein
MDTRLKIIAAFLGLLTAIVVLIGSLTDFKFRPGTSGSTNSLPTTTAANGINPPNPRVGGGGGGGGDGGGSTTSETTKKPPADTCVQGYVWREAVPDDHVCVTPETRSQTRDDNRLAGSRVNPDGGPYGPDTCRQGFVWREAVSDDHVCVLPKTRSQAWEDNRLAESRRIH